MRKSLSFLFSLAFILCFQASANQDSFAGTWTNPTVRAQADYICCIPDSIFIEKSESGYIATYSFSKTWPNPNVQCLFLFSTSGKQDLIVTQKLDGNEYGASIELVNNTFVEAFSYKVGNNSSLDIKIISINGDTVGVGCDFTMLDFEPTVVDTPVGTWVNPIVHVQIDSACCVPDSIVIEGSGPTYNATYSYVTGSSSPNLQCSALFAGSSGKKDLVVTKKSDGDEYGASLVLFKNIVIEGFYYSLNNHGSQLNVYNSPINGNTVGAVCNFTMDYSPSDMPLGTWTNATIRAQRDPDCCIPDSLVIEKSGSGYRSQYFFMSSNLQCTSLFSKSNERSMNLTKIAGNDYFGASLLYGNFIIEGFRYKINNNSKLDIFYPPTAENLCYFTLNNFQSASSGTL